MTAIRHLSGEIPKTLTRLAAAGWRNLYFLSICKTVYFVEMKWRPGCLSTSLMWEIEHRPARGFLIPILLA